MATMDYCALKFKSPLRLSHTEIGAIDISETAAEILLLLHSYVIAAMPLSINGRNIPWESAVAKIGHKSERSAVSLLIGLLFLGRRNM